MGAQGGSRSPLAQRCDQQVPEGCHKGALAVADWLWKTAGPRHSLCCFWASVFVLVCLRALPLSDTPFRSHFCFPLSKPPPNVPSFYTKSPGLETDGVGQRICISSLRGPCLGRTFGQWFCGVPCVHICLFCRLSMRVLPLALPPFTPTPLQASARAEMDEERGATVA